MRTILSLLFYVYIYIFFNTLRLCFQTVDNEITLYARRIVAGDVVVQILKSLEHGHIDNFIRFGRVAKYSYYQDIVFETAKWRTCEIFHSVNNNNARRHSVSILQTFVCAVSKTFEL